MLLFILEYIIKAAASYNIYTNNFFYSNFNCCLSCKIGSNVNSPKVGFINSKYIQQDSCYCFVPNVMEYFASMIVYIIILMLQ